MTCYTIRSPLAMCASAISGALSILLLIEPALKEGLTLETGIPAAMAVGLVVITIITGILAHGAGWTLAGFGLVALSVACSAVIVFEQTGRRAHVRNQTAVVVVDTTAERARLTQLRAEADQILAKHRVEQAKECASGKGKRCDGISYTVRTWEAARDGYDAKLRGLPVLAPDAKGEFAGRLAGLLGRDAATARAWVTLLDPLAFPFVLELCSILCGVFAFGPIVSTNSRRVTPSSDSRISKADFPGFPAGKSQETTPVAAIAASDEAIAESQKSVERTRQTVSLLDIVDDVLVPIVTQRGGRVDSQAYLAKLSNLSEGTVSKMLAKSNRLERVWNHQSKCNVIQLRRRVE